MRKKILFMLILLFSIISAIALAHERDIFAVIKKGTAKQLNKYIKNHPGALSELNSHGFPPLVVAISMKNNVAIEVLLKHRVDPDAEYLVEGETIIKGPLYNSPARAAVWQSNLDAIKLFVKYGWDVNRPYMAIPMEVMANGKRGKLHPHYHIFMAVKVGSPELVQYMIDHGADLHVSGYKDRSLVDTIKYHFPSSTGEERNSWNIEKLKILLKAGADFNSQDDDGKTLLIRVVSVLYKTMNSRAKTMQAECIKILVEGGVDLDRQDEEGWTALHCAVWFNNTEAVKALVKAGADPEIELLNGETPRDFALKLKRKKIAAILEKAENTDN